MAKLRPTNQVEYKKGGGYLNAVANSCRGLLVVIEIPAEALNSKNNLIFINLYVQFCLLVLITRSSHNDFEDKSYSSFLINALQYYLTF